MKRKSRNFSVVKNYFVVEKKEKGIGVRVWCGFQGIEQLVVGDVSLKMVCMKVLFGDWLCIVSWFEKVKKFYLIYGVFSKYLYCINIEEVCGCQNLVILILLL